MLKNDVIWPISRYYKSGSRWEPIAFFSECLQNATHFDLMLGFFSSSAIAILSDSFASFIYNGGNMRLIINDILTVQDKEAMSKASLDKYVLPEFDINNLAKLKNVLSNQDKHFFECLSWLYRHNRIEVKIVSPKGSNGISHTKCGIFSDGINKVAFNGSCNFTRTALISNIEDITASCDWDGPTTSARVSEVEEDFINTFEEKNDALNYLKVDNVRTQIVNNFDKKELSELLKDEYDLLSEKSVNNEIRPEIKNILARATERVKQKIESIEAKANSLKEDEIPHFPYTNGPRDYQMLAFENWKANKQKGLFAMATGTGKTITSLNCLLEIYKRCGYYKSIILVPTITLVNQWEIECKKFNFLNIIKVCSKNPRWRDKIDSIITKERIQGKDNKVSYVIISTYASFVKKEVFDSLTVFPKTKLLLIADEAHNMGAKRIMELMNGIPYLRRIGLSATPQRQYAEDINKTVFNFFGVDDKFTYEYNMQEAINNKVLCKYYYYPHLVKLTNAEMDEYIDISLKLAKFFNNDKFDDSNEILTALLLKRKRIIHKAVNKLEVFKSIINERFKEKGDLKYTLVYVPEGIKPDTEDADIYDTNDEILNDEFSENLIDIYTGAIKDLNSHITVRKFTAESKDRDLMLNQFSDGEIQVLTSMKCLDEGVDVPRSELAIFCASTGNPRQFIQRRGRILRKHEDKHMAIIHDLVVVPEVNTQSDSYEMEKKLLRNELLRVREFSMMSENSDDTIKELEEIINYYNLSIF